MKMPADEALFASGVPGLPPCTTRLPRTTLFLSSLRGFEPPKTAMRDSHGVVRRFDVTAVSVNLYTLAPSALIQIAWLLGLVACSVAPSPHITVFATFISSALECR